MRVALIAIVLFSTPLSHAADLLSFFDSQCQRYTGLMARVDESGIYLVNLRGGLVHLDRSQASSLVIHQPLENPLPELVIDAPLARRLRRVWIGDDSAPSFTGWATSFYDDLYIFLDIDGKTHVLDPGDIAKLEPLEEPTGPHRPAIVAPVALGFPPEIVPCSSQVPPPRALPPSQVIADRIKLGDYLAKLEEHYRALDGFEERTRVYAEPFVFDEASRVGLVYWQDMDLPVPFYFRWSSGRPYRFQSETVIGNASHPWLPFTAPTFSVRSDVKSHFFNATFVGNFLALPAGEDPFILDSIYDFLDGEQQEINARVDVSYNYMIMMGADYWRLSASAGPAYIAARIVVPSPDPEFPEQTYADIVPADALSPSARLRYQSPDLSARLVYFNTRISGPLAGAGFDLPTSDATFKLRMDTARAGITLRIIDEITLDLDEIVTIGRYEARSDVLMITSGLDFMHSETAAWVSADFGRYVTVKGYGRFFARRYAIDGTKSETRFETAFGGGLEFVF